MRCYGHVLKLVGKAVLHGTDIKEFLSNETRRNSTYLIIRRALLKLKQIDWFIPDSKTIKDFNQRIPADGILDGEDWNLLVEFKDILELLYRGCGKGDGHRRVCGRL